MLDYQNVWNEVELHLFEKLTREPTKSEGEWVTISTTSYGRRDIKIPFISQQIVFRPLSTLFFLESESMPFVRSDVIYKI